MSASAYSWRLASQTTDIRGHHPSPRGPAKVFTSSSVVQLMMEDIGTATSDGPETPKFIPHHDRRLVLALPPYAPPRCRKIHEPQECESCTAAWHDPLNVRKRPTAIKG